MTKLAPGWVRTSDPVIRSPARYRWTTAPANFVLRNIQLCHRQKIVNLIYLNFQCHVYIRNKIGPNMDPWGMPHLISNYLLMK